MYLVIQLFQISEILDEEGALLVDVFHVIGENIKF